MASILTSRYQPIASQAEITSKAKPDKQEIERRKVVGITNSSRVYPGASSPNMFAILPGEILMGRRGRKAEKMYSGSFLESCLSSVSGLDATANPEQVMRDHYFVGIAKVMDMAQDADFYGDHSLEHGFAATRHGSYSTANNNSWRYDINAGDLIEITLPPVGAPSGVGAGSAEPLPHFDTGLNTIQRNTMHAPVTKPLWQTVPFNPNDFSTARLGVWVLLAKLVGQDIRRYMADGRSPLTTLEEETGAWALGVLGLLQRLPGGAPPGSDIVNDKFSQDNITLLTSLFAPPQTGESKVKAEWFNNMTRGTTGVYHAKASRILGVALNGAKPGDQLNVAIGQGRTGF